MKNFTFLALQGPNGKPDDLARIAEKAVAVGGRLNVLHLGPVPLLPYALTPHPYGMPTIPDSWVEKRNTMARNLAEHQKETREYLLKQGLSGEVSTFCVEPSAFHDIVGLRSIFCDVGIVLDSLRSSKVTFDNIVYGLLFDGPGPAILNTEKNPKALSPDNVFIAWDSSVPAIRAVRAALPLLKEAKEVTIACLDADPSRYADGQSPGSDLATWLSHHGVNVTVQEYATGHDNVGGALQMRAKETTADLVVMGAYGRSRWNERFFGGTTETMIAQRDLPVLLAH
ncbi:universal stress protein [Yoonia sp. F2084L]|uniref:universal stress protein n=1 Tax=Yoonia sp. F2084L TaxID=2926419 RepID=UPI001FF1975C|nr:universal stress protein [Yoonia sp. F2084L]MCK0097334.1 universal stress protein [Yoonia sp. F2084L]